MINLEYYKDEAKDKNRHEILRSLGIEGRPRNERWKQFQDTGYYVSTEGRICHLYKNGKTKMLKPYLKRGSMYVHIQRREMKMSRIIWETFMGPVPEGYRIIHRNGAATMNDLNNLQCVSLHELGKKTGYKSKQRLVKNLDTGKIYRGTRAAAEALHISRQTVCDYCNHKTKKPMYRLEWVERR